MSKEDDKSMILVCHFGGKSWVIENAKWDLDWLTQAQAHISDGEKRFMYDRTRALTLAHNIHNRLDTEYGVWEVFSRKEDGDGKKPTTQGKKPGKGSKAVNGSEE